MKILYVVSRPLEINTSASIRNRATIMGLVENGHDVDLVTTEPDKNHFAYDKSMHLENVRITYIKLDGIQSAARIGRKIKILKPIKNLAIKYFESHNIYDNLKGIINHTSQVNINDYDIIISSSDPKSSHLFVETAIKKSKQKYVGKWIQIWGDPFFSDITLSESINKKNIYFEEKRLLSLCNRIVYVSKLTLETQKKLYSEYSDKMMFIPIPYLNEVKTPNRNFKDVKTIRLAYCGDYASQVRNIMPLYDAVIESNLNINLTICGNSDLNLLPVNNINIFKRQEYNIVEEIEKNADILIHISNLSGSQIPGKIYQYTGTTKPILFILDGDEKAIREQFEQFNRFYFVRNNSKEVQEMIRKIIFENKQFECISDFSKMQIAKKIIS